MSVKKIIIIILLILLIAGILIVAYEYMTTSPQQNLMKGDHKILLLTADPSETRPGMGGVDMAFVMTTHDGKIVNTEPIYPGTLSHPTAPPPQYLKQAMGVDRLYLHDALWDENIETGSKLAQEIVEYNTGFKTDAVVIMTPQAVDAILKTIGPVYVQGQGYVSGNSIQFLRNEQNGGMSRGNAVESLMKSIMNATKDPNTYKAVLKTGAAEYTKGNIAVVPKDLFLKLLISNGLNYVI